MDALPKQGVEEDPRPKRRFVVYKPYASGPKMIWSSGVESLYIYSYRVKTLEHSVQSKFSVKESADILRVSWSTARETLQFRLAPWSRASACFDCLAYTSN